MTATELSFALAIVAVTHFVGAIAAFGSSFLAVPFLVLAFGHDRLPRIVLVIMAVGAVQAGLICLRTRRDIVWRLLVPLCLGALAGLPLGAWGAHLLPGPAVLLLLGGLLVGAGLGNLLAPPRERGRPPVAVSGGVALLGGVIHGAFASGGTLLVAAVQRWLPDKEGFRATLAALWSCLNGVYLVLACFRPDLEAGDWGLAGLAALVVAPVTWLGDRCAARLDRRLFNRGVCLLLVLSGLAVLAKVAGVAGAT